MMKALNNYILEKFKLGKEPSLVTSDDLADDDLKAIIDKVLKENKRLLSIFKRKYTISPTKDGRFRIHFLKTISHDTLGKFAQLIKKEFYKSYSDKEYKFSIVLGTDLSDWSSDITIGVGKA